MSKYSLTGGCGIVMGTANSLFTHSTPFVNISPLEWSLYWEHAHIRWRNTFTRISCHWWVKVCLCWWKAGLCSTHFFGLTRLWLIWQSRWLNSDSTQIPNLLTSLNSASTQNLNLLTWLYSDSTHLSQSWVNSDSRLITFYLIWEKVVDRGEGVRSNVAVGWFFLCKVTDNCKILTFSLRKISDSTLTQTVSSWLNSDSNDNQRDSTLTWLISWIFTADSWVEHNPDGKRRISSMSTIPTSSLCLKHLSWSCLPRREPFLSSPSL